MPQAAAVFTVIAAVASVIQGIQAAKAAKRTARDQKEALDKKFKAEKEARDIAGASDKTRAARDRQKAEREKRVRLAKIRQQALNTGADLSSPSLGAQGALSSGVSGTIAAQAGFTTAREGISAAQQKSAEASRDFSLAPLNNRPSDTFGTIALIAGGASKVAGSSLFSTTPSIPNTSAVPPAGVFNTGNVSGI